MRLVIIITAVIRIILMITLLLFTFLLNAQSVSINNDGSAAHSSSILEIKSTTKGFLIPRMSTANRTAIAAPADGLLVFDTDTKGLWCFTNNLWNEIPKTSNGFSLPYSGFVPDNNKLFSIINTSASNSRVAIHGKGSNVFTGLLAGNPIGVWGEEDQGMGVSGTSIGGRGVYGYSQNNIGMYGKSSGSIGNGGMGGYFENSNTGFGLYATSHLGLPAKFEILNSNNPYPAFIVNTKGSNSAIHVTSDSADFPNQFLINGSQSGTGGGLRLAVGNENSSGIGAEIYNNGSGAGIRVLSKKGHAGFFYTNNAANSNSVIYATTSGTGSPGHFWTDNNNNTSPVLHASTTGTGPGIEVNNTNANAVNSLATFKKNGINKTRIDGTGKGFFNGGTQNSGADIAEAFDVADDITIYEAGDVLIISTEKDRSVVRSNGAYSTLVAGVYATKPGVLLTEEDIETDISDKVPMGVVGVIPTKVCLEGGEIKRGDLLVTSSIPGVAMKADIEKVKPGQVIGKALENFNSSLQGKIRVLVNVK